MKNRIQVICPGMLKTNDSQAFHPVETGGHSSVPERRRILISTKKAEPFFCTFREIATFEVAFEEFGFSVFFEEAPVCQRASFFLIFGAWRVIIGSLPATRSSLDYEFLLYCQCIVRLLNVLVSTHLVLGYIETFNFLLLRNTQPNRNFQQIQ